MKRRFNNFRRRSRPVTLNLLGRGYRFEARGALDFKGKGPMETFFLERAASD
jgi:hypothetical protein